MSFVNRETRALFKLTLPIMATQMAQIGMGTVDTLMSGYVSTQDLAAVAIGTSLWLPVWLFLAGILVALSPLVS
ncbi:MATE family efflux transporter, partial [Wenyingzhuangia sp. 1_MG-2023]|nr:MATE family efflux transporter [Wenyingzhuangia sp. 1_MG-2023]